VVEEPYYDPSMDPSMMDPYGADTTGYAEIVGAQEIVGGQEIVGYQEIVGADGSVGYMEIVGLAQPGMHLMHQTGFMPDYEMGAVQAQAGWDPLLGWGHEGFRREDPWGPREGWGREAWGREGWGRRWR
jgi:hypothetical protein